MSGESSGPVRTAVRRSYDRSAQDYDERFAALQQPKYRGLLGEGASRLGPWLAEGLVLDLGCGTGLLGEFAAASGHDVHRLVGVDFSLPMLRVARGRMGALVHAGMERLPFRSGTFAAVVAFTSLGLLPGPGSDDQGLAELRRVLVPAGSFAITTLAASADRVAGRLAAAGLICEDGIACGQDVGYLGIVGAPGRRRNG